MTQNKELLLKDLCARLPYGVKCKYYNVYENCHEEGTILGFERKEYIEIDGRCANVEEIKPYLFPISSMTEEQKEEWRGIRWSKLPWEELDWLNKGHWDYRHLIEKGLAIDATGLNVY